tara:strand:- start:52 stop:831 length:780 start_codon:yes stop_codon:yes gene_type:complete
MNSNSILNNFLYFLFFSVVFVIYLPIIVMIIFSFNSSKYQIMPFRNFTTEWYNRVLNDSQYLDGLLNSLMVSITVSLLATTLAFFCSYSLVNSDFKGKSFLNLFFLTPLVVPLILIGISLRFYLTAQGYEPSLYLVTIGQSIFVMPLAILNLSNRMSQIPKNLEEAAWSLGSSRIRSMFEIILPACKFSLIATFILTFTFAFDEFIIAYFLNNFSITLPIKIWTSLVTGFDPAINAIGTLVFLTSLTLGLTAQLLFMKK